MNLDALIRHCFLGRPLIHVKETKFNNNDISLPSFAEFRNVSAEETRSRDKASQDLARVSDTTQRTLPPYTLQDLAPMDQGSHAPNPFHSIPETLTETAPQLSGPSRSMPHQPSPAETAPAPRAHDPGYAPKKRQIKPVTQLMRTHKHQVNHWTHKQVFPLEFCQNPDVGEDCCSPYAVHPHIDLRQITIRDIYGKTTGEMIRHQDDRVWDVIYICGDCGLRVCEPCKINWEDANYEPPPDANDALTDVDGDEDVDLADIA